MLLLCDPRLHDAISYCLSLLTSTKGDWKDSSSEEDTEAHLPVVRSACGCQQPALVTFLLLRQNTLIVLDPWEGAELGGTDFFGVGVGGSASLWGWREQML